MIRLKLVFFFLFHNSMKTTFAEAEDGEMETLVLYHLAEAHFKLKTVSDETGHQFQITLRNQLTVPPLKSLQIPMDFHLMMNNLQAYLSSPGIVDGGICTLGEVK